MDINSFDVLPLITKEKLDYIIDSISEIKIGIIGDICLDIYWKADMTKSELSRETPHFPLPVVEEYMSPGAGGNAAANIAALKPVVVKVISVIGNDWRGKELLKELANRNIDTNEIIISGDVITNTYCKPYKMGLSDLEYEDPRIDFANYRILPEKEENELLEKLWSAASTIDVLCVSDQFMYGCITPRVREEIIKLAKDGLKVIVDSRDRIQLFTDVVMKPNEIEGYKAVYKDKDPRDASLDELINAARILSRKNNSIVCMTLGSKGCICADKERIVHIPAYEVEPPIDICGAGDTFLSAFSCALTTGATSWDAASFASIASQVTIKKMKMTGTASSEEIKARYNQVKNSLNIK